MEHLIVEAVDNSNRPILLNANVLVDGQVNGKVGYQMQLDEGFAEISIDHQGSQTKTIELKGTSPKKPMKVKIQILFNQKSKNF